MKNLSVSYLNTSELHTISTSMLLHTKTLNEKYSLMGIAAKCIQQNIVPLSNSLKHNQTNIFTDQLSDSDTSRDDIGKGLVRYIKAFISIGTDEQKEAARYLLHSFDSFGSSLFQESYEVESTLLTELFKVWDGEKATAAFKAINALQVYQNLKREQNEFSALWGKRNEQEPSENLYPELKRAKAALKPKLKYILGSLEILNEEFPDDEDLNAAIEQIDAVVEKIMATARGRKTRNSVVSE